MTAHVRSTALHSAPGSRTADQAPATGHEHAPEVLFALSALLVVLAGPVTSAFAPRTGLVSALAATALIAGIVLAVVAGLRVLRS